MAPEEQQQQQQQQPASWGYSAQTTNSLLTPDQWAKYYPTGQRQSPIDIQLDALELRQLSCAGCGLSERLQQQLKLTDPTRSKPARAGRKHLDSLGDDEEEEEEDEDDDEDYDLEPGQRSGLSSASSSPAPAGTHHADSSGRSSAASSSCSASSNGRTRSPTRAKQPLDNGNRATTKRLQQVRRNQATSNHKLVAEARRPATTQQVAQNTRYCVTNKKIFLGYPRYLGSVPLRNTGHAWQIDLPTHLAEHTLLCGPPLGDREYRLAQLHCHWGEHCNQGSEHQINGKSFAAEIHFVHWNCSQFKSAEEASRHKHGLAVVAVLVEALEEANERNKHLDKIISGLAHISQPETSTSLEACRLDLKKLLPQNRWNYATYEGSLTTPPLNEVVDWIVFLQPIQCSREQVEHFRQLKCHTGNHLLRNCRPVQAHHDRPVSIWTHSHAN